MKVTTRIKVDLARQNFCGQVDAVQGDGNTRCIEVTLRQNGVPWEPPEGAAAAVAYTKPDRTKGLYDKLADDTPAITVDGSIVTVILAPQMLTVPGTVQAGIVFNNAQLDQLTTFPFPVRVEKNPFAGAQESQDYIRLQWLEDKLQAYIDQIDGVDAEAVRQIIAEYMAENPQETITDEKIAEIVRQEMGALQPANVYTLETVTVPVSAWEEIPDANGIGTGEYEAVVNGSDAIYTNSNLDVFVIPDADMARETARCGVMAYEGRADVSYAGNAVVFKAATVPNIDLTFHVRVWAERKLSYEYDSDTLTLTIMEE